MKEEIKFLLIELQSLGKDVSEIRLWQELVEVMDDQDQVVLLNNLRQEKELILRSQ